MDFFFNCFPLFLLKTYILGTRLNRLAGAVLTSFWSKNKKNRFSPVYSSFRIYKWGMSGVYISCTCFPDDDSQSHCRIVHLEQERIQLVGESAEVKASGEVIKQERDTLLARYAYYLIKCYVR